MDFQCENCQKTIAIPDEKVPQGKTFALSCPHCKHKNKFSADAGKKEAPVKKKAAPEKKAAPPSEPARAADDASNGEADKQFEFIPEGTKVALVCETDEGLRTAVINELNEMEYHVKESQSPRDSLKQMRFRDFDLLVLNERFGARDPDMNHVLKYIEQLPMSTRRNMFVALITDRFRTMDNMMAFNKSVNVVINTENMNEFGKILDKAVSDNEWFYRIFKESLKKIGQG